MENTCTEGISGSGCLNCILLYKRFHFYNKIFIISTASFPAHGYKDQWNMISLKDPMYTLCEIFFSGQPLDLVIRNL